MCLTTYSILGKQFDIECSKMLKTSLTSLTSCGKLLLSNNAKVPHMSYSILGKLNASNYSTQVQGGELIVKVLKYLRINLSRLLISMRSVRFY